MKSLIRFRRVVFIVFFRIWTYMKAFCIYRTFLSGFRKNFIFFRVEFTSYFYQYSPKMNSMRKCVKFYWIIYSHVQVLHSKRKMKNLKKNSNYETKIFLERSLKSTEAWLRRNQCVCLFTIDLFILMNHWKKKFVFDLLVPTHR